MAKTRSPRAAARRAVLVHLREIKKVTAHLSEWWNVRATVYVPRDAHQPGANAMLRDRLPGEYPEAQARYWASTVTKVDEMIAELDKLRALAVSEFHKCEREN